MSERNLIDPALLFGKHPLTQLQQELHNALHEPFPIRGWTLQFVRTPAPERPLFHAYLEKPLTDEMNRIMQPEPAKETILSIHTKLTMEFKILPVMLLFGREVRMNPECVDKQAVSLNFEQLGLEVTVDAKQAPKFEMPDAWFPDSGHFASIVERWQGRVKDDTRAVYVMAELNAIRENYLRSLRRYLSDAAAVVQARSPDYWTHIESTMTGGMTPAYLLEACQPVVSIREIPRSMISQTKSRVN